MSEKTTELDCTDCERLGVIVNKVQEADVYVTSVELDGGDTLQVQGTVQFEYSR